MEGKAVASRNADMFDPLALTLGSIYAAATAAPPSASPPPPPPPPPTTVAPRRLNNGTALIRAAPTGAPASPPTPLRVAPHAALRRLNNDMALIRAAAGVGAPASPAPPSLTVAPHAALRRLDKGKAVMYAASAGALASPPPPPPPMVSPRPTYRLYLNNVPAPMYVPTAPPSPPPAPPSTPIAPCFIHHRRVGRPGINPPRADAIDDLLVQVPPFPWATERPGQHGTLQSLLRRGITSVVGYARCKRCAARRVIAYDLESKFWELRGFIVANRHAMDDRAPRAWVYPALPACVACWHRGAMWPEIPDNKLEINWLFLFLGQMLGCCTLEQLKYFCMNNGQHRTGAKNRVLYYAYIEMSNQLLSFD